MKTRTGAYGRVVPRKRRRLTGIERVSVRVIACLLPAAPILYTETVAGLPLLALLYLLAERIQILIDWWHEFH